MNDENSLPVNARDGEQMSDEEKAEIRARLERVTQMLAAWITTEDWAASQRYLAQHQAELLSDEAFATLHYLILQNPEEESLQLHAGLLQLSREKGIDSAYGQFLEAVHEAERQAEAERKRRAEVRRAERERKRERDEAVEKAGRIVSLLVLLVLIGLIVPDMVGGYRSMQAKAERQAATAVARMSPTELRDYARRAGITVDMARAYEEVIAAPAFQTTQEAMEEAAVTDVLVRQQALEELQLAVEKQQYEAALRLADLFVAHGGEAEQVRQWREQAVRIAEKRAELHQQLMTAVEGQEALSVIEPMVDEYLQLSADFDEAQKQEVLDGYSQAFVFWYTRQARPLSAEAEAQVQQYRRLMEIATAP